MNGHVIEIGNVKETQNDYEENENYNGVRTFIYEVLLMVYLVLMVFLVIYRLDRMDGNASLFMELIIILLTSIILIYMWKMNIMYAFICQCLRISVWAFLFCMVYFTGLSMRLFLR